VDPETTPSRRHGTAATGAVASLVALWWAGDGLVQLLVILIAAWLNPLLVLAVAFVELTVINTACCNWIDGNWDRWMAGRAGRQLERRLEKMRSGRLMRRPAAWMSGGSDASFAVAAALTNAITTVAVARLVGGQPVSKRRRLLAAGAFSLFVASLGALLGFVLRDIIRAI
jgi:hypothetical protein